MGLQDASSSRKTYVVDTSILVAAPDSVSHLTPDNLVVIPFPVLEELDSRRTAANGVGYTARNTIRLIDRIQSQASAEQLQSGIPYNGGMLQFHNGQVNLDHAWPGFKTDYADDAIILLASEYQHAHPADNVILLTRDAAMRCKARARGVPAEDYYSDRPVSSPDQFYSGRIRIEIPADHAGLLSTLHHEQRLPAEALANFVDVSELLVNQCCELHVGDTHKSAWGLFKREGGVGFLRRVVTKPSERFGPCSAEQACARELILDPETLITSVVGIAGTGKTLIALLSAYEMFRAGRVSRIEVYRLNAEAGRQLGFLPGDVGDKMAPWARPIIDNMDFILRRLHGNSRWSNPIADHQPEKGERRDTPPSVTVEHLLQTNALEIAPINYLRGRSIHDAVIIVDDGQNLTQEDMKLVLTRAGEGARVILTGDPDQIDRPEINALSNGLVQVVERFKGEACFGHLRMTDVVRSKIAELAAKLL
jgi:PhoH-like ATPase